MPASGGSLLSQAAVVVGVAPTLLSAINATRTTVIIRNNGANTVFLGNSAVTIANGMPLQPGDTAPGDTFSLPATGAVYGVVAAATEEVRVLEIGD